MPVLERSDTSLYYELTGSGPPVLFIQGTGVAGSGWKLQIEDLSSDFRCLSFDNRGIGRSTIGKEKLTVARMAEDARALLDAVGWESAHVVGHSLGGLIAEQLALDTPHRVRSLALLCTFAKGPEAARVTPTVLWMGIRTRIGTRAMRRNAFLRMIFTDSFIRSEGANELARRVQPIIGRDLADSPPILIRQLAAMRDYDASHRLGELAPIPTLVVSAAHDPIALTAYGRGLSKRIPGSQHTEIANASHAVIIEMPARVNQLLRSHVEACPVSAATAYNDRK
jgi:pimeloyl-ACP methyl ester carboxylesterase